MKKAKEFDCVAMKNEIQAKHAQDYMGMSPAQVCEEVQRKLATSNHPVAAWWRSVSKSKRRCGV